MSAWLPYLAVGLGSGLGSALRYWVSLGMLAALGSYFPWGTLLVNVLGSCLIGWLATLGAHYAQGHLVRLQPLLVAGFCGGFTTFSLFSLETLHLFQEDHFALAFLYVATSVPLWLAAALCGQRIAKKQIQA
ncbi:fluoride efflux transporter CrcB [Halovibrio sp. HP20-50]|uniref:fluoride efflux transporter CrcB n=1 Tax=Halovibrio sp. HP20-59 TaxID=3080275 RepID=UPI00294B72F3|nr:fluoride efflux transporter CrcB [Halovibrio sp. HP20-59]MEA2117088.1 fluoride efflux transporter CrcB [Halovibrio sp. HP20-59]